MSETGAKEEIRWNYGAQIAVPSVKHQRLLGIRALDWARSMKSIDRLRKPVPSFSFEYNALAGASVTLAATVIPLCFASGLASWVIPAYVIGAIATGTLAVRLYFVEKRQVRLHNEDVEEVLGEMREIEKQFSEERLP